MRSLLFVPGDSERKLEKAFGAGADAVIVDLEDSVSAQDKQRARDIAAQFIAGHARKRDFAVYVRINDFSTGLTEGDLDAVIPAHPDGIMLPKSNGGPDVQRLSAMLRPREVRNGLPDGGIAILPIITETAAGIFSASTYAGSSARLAGVTWGAEDLSSAVGARTTRDEHGAYTDLFRLARSTTILAASAAGVAAIDTVYPDFRDMEGFERDCRDAERDGFTGKLAIHPAQIAVINAAFTPSREAVQQAAAVIAAFEAAGHPGVVAIDGKMYDRPHLKLAERLVASAAATNPSR